MTKPVFQMFMTFFYEMFTFCFVSYLNNLTPKQVILSFYVI